MDPAALWQRWYVDFIHPLADKWVCFIFSISVQPCSLVLTSSFISSTQPCFFFFCAFRMIWHFTCQKKINACLWLYPFVVVSSASISRAGDCRRLASLIAKVTSFRLQNQNWWIHYEASESPVVHYCSAVNCFKNTTNVCVSFLSWLRWKKAKVEDWWT